MNLKQMILLMLLTLAAIPAMAQGVEVDYNNPKKYIVGGVKVEGNNYDIRKSLLQYDDVMNDQRDIIYKKRNRILK